MEKVKRKNIQRRFLPSAMHRRDRPAPSGPKDNSRWSRVAHDRRGGTSLVPFAPEMTTAAARAASGSRNSRMRSTLAARTSREHLAFPVVALHHFFLSYTGPLLFFPPWIRAPKTPLRRNSEDPGGKHASNAWWESSSYTNFLSWLSFLAKPRPVRSFLPALSGMIPRDDVTSMLKKGPRCSSSSSLEWLWQTFRVWSILLRTCTATLPK